MQIGAAAGGLIGFFMGDPKKKKDQKENMPALAKGFCGLDDGARKSDRGRPSHGRGFGLGRRQGSSDPIGGRERLWDPVSFGEVSKGGSKTDPTKASRDRLDDPGP